MKQCAKCGAVKPIDDFYRATGTRDGHRGECKVCNLAAKKAWYLANRDAVKAKVKRWQQDNAERHNAQQRSRRQDPARKRKERDGHLRRKFGITIERFEEILATQGGVCAICGREPNPNISLHVDHDHDTGAIRGLTCFRCNQALGAFGEDASLLRQAAVYLDQHDPEVAEQRELVLARVRQLPRPVWEQSAEPPLASGAHDRSALRTGG
jgi:hypothetical protein